MCLCPNFEHDPDCDPPGLQAPACDACGSTEDVVPYQGVPLCVSCTAEQRAEDEAVPVPVAVDEPPTERVVHTVRCPACGEKLVTLSLIEGGHRCPKVAA